MAHSKDVTIPIEEDSAGAGLSFQDIPHAEGEGRTHTFTNFPDSAVDSEREDAGDQAELLPSEKKAPSFMTFEYYQQFFDVDSSKVLRRIVGSFVPNPRGNFLQQHIRPNPDLYGPFWICVTLVFSTAIAGNLANYFASKGDNEWVYDFHKVSLAATAAFSYWWGVPSLLWGVLWWRGRRAGLTYLEIICVYGYSLAIFLPLSILWMIPVPWLQWLLLVVGTLMSGSVLVLTFWPALSQDDRKVALGVTAIIVIFHILLATGFMLYFFHYPAPVTTGQTDLITSTPIILKTTHNAVPEKQSNPAVKQPETNARKKSASGSKPEETSKGTKSAIDDKKDLAAAPDADTVHGKDKADKVGVENADTANGKDKADKVGVGNADTVNGKDKADKVGVGNADTANGKDKTDTAGVENADTANGNENTNEGKVKDTSLPGDQPKKPKAAAISKKAATGA